MTRAKDLGPGTRLGPYTLHERLGQGATAAVYLATDGHGRRFALKVRHLGESAMDRRFLREFESMRLLRVPGVVRVHEAGGDGEVLWFSMDLVEGRPFLQAVHADPDPAGRVSRTLELGRRLCETLAALHEAGFVHRDIKPSNVLVDDAGEVHVLDFGIGRYFTASDTLSMSGEVVGTVPYMAPEQLAGLPNDAQVDVFATGLMLYECLAGRRPRPLTAVGWIPRICLDRLPALASIQREVPRGLSAVVERMLRVDPRARPSAREVAWSLRQVASVPQGSEWPEPAFVDPGDWWATLAEGCLGGTEPVWILEGPSGSGRARIAEQVHRQGLLQGTWTLNLRCRCDHLGGPFLQLLDQLVALLDDDTLATILGDGFPALREVWPHLPSPRATAVDDGAGLPSTGALVGALSGVVARLAKSRPIVLVFQDLEQVDGFTARALRAVADAAGPRLGVLLLHEPRWATPRSTALVEALAAAGAKRLQIPMLDEAAGRQLAASVCPHAPVEVPAGSTPQYAVERGWQALAGWRGETFEPPVAALWPVSVGVDEVPVAVYRGLVGRRADRVTPWIRRSSFGVALDGDAARAMARSRLAGLQKSAATLALTWQATLGAAARPADIATLWLLAGDEPKAWVPAARAAIEADHRGLYADARRWLLLLETIPAPARAAVGLAFDVALVKARVALRTDAIALRVELVDAAEALATTAEQEHRVRTVRAEYGLRAGTVRPALVTALRLASSGASPQVMARALLVAVHGRLVLGQLDEAERELGRADALLAADPDPVLQVQAGNWRAELAFTRHALSRCRALCQTQIREASALGYVRGVAFAASRLGQVLRMLGKRREAEHQTRSAREAFASTGDVYLDVESGLALATLLVERGESLGARQILDATIRRIRGLRLDHLLPAANRIALQVATLRADPTDAAIALTALADAGSSDPELPAALVRWWRTRGDLPRALAVGGPAEGTWGHVAWRLERARAALVSGRPVDVRAELAPAQAAAAALGFEELTLYAKLLAAAVDGADDPTWSALQESASASVYTEVYLGALELDARRLSARGDPDGARARWQALSARSAELGYRPGLEEAAGWLVIDEDASADTTVESTLPGRRPIL